MVEADLLRAFEEVRILAHDAGASGCSNNWLLAAFWSSGAWYLPGQSQMQIHEGPPESISGEAFFP